MSREDIQKVVVEERRLARVIEAIYQEIATLERNILERRMALTTINEDLKDPLKDKSVLVPIGGQIYVPSHLSTTDQVLVNVGASIYITKGREDAKAFLEERLEALEKVYRDRMNLLQDLKKRHDGMIARLLEYQARRERSG